MTHSIDSIRAGLLKKEFSAEELARQSLADAEKQNPTASRRSNGQRGEFWSRLPCDPGGPGQDQEAIDVLRVRAPESDKNPNDGAGPKREYRGRCECGLRNRRRVRHRFYRESDLLLGRW